MVPQLLALLDCFYSGSMSASRLNRHVALWMDVYGSTEIISVRQLQAMRILAPDLFPSCVSLSLPLYPFAFRVLPKIPCVIFFASMDFADAVLVQWYFGST